MDWKNDLNKLLLTGNITDLIQTKVTEDHADAAYKLLIKASQEDPEYLLHEIFSAINYQVYHMLDLAVAVLITNAPDSFWNLKTGESNNKLNLQHLINSFDPLALIDLVKMIREKGLGKGLGSRPQKLIRNTMEAWDVVTLKLWIEEQPRSLYALLRIIHPRFKDERGVVIKKFLGSPSMH